MTRVTSIRRCARLCPLGGAPVAVTLAVLCAAQSTVADPEPATSPPGDVTPVERAPLDHPPSVDPSEAVKLFTVPDDLQIRLVVAEPDVSQPLSISFDDRGRMWVLQYLQYPNPEGLKAVQMDNWLRTKYDRIPPPPPDGPQGKDRISIYEDRDGDGRPETIKHFLSNLNLASGFALGHEGVFVVQPPYLLFYADRNHDDVPDGDPEVLLTGFGMEDAHAFANSLTWGPDGWLYGCQGSTATADIRGIGFQQGVWRYHPLTREFELFGEGGGNSWGVEFDRYGNVFSAGNEVEPLVHMVQGGVLRQGVRQAWPPAQSAHVRLLPAGQAHRLCRRQPQRGRGDLSGRRLPEAVRQPRDRAAHAAQRDAVGEDPSVGIDVCHRACRRLHHHQRHLVPADRTDRRPGRRAVRRRLVRLQHLAFEPAEPLGMVPAEPVRRPRVAGRTAGRETDCVRLVRPGLRGAVRNSSNCSRTRTTGTPVRRGGCWRSVATGPSRRS